MEFYDVNFSYIDNETFEEKYVSVPEQGGDTLIPEGMGAPGQLYTISRGKSGMIGAFRLESQMLPGSGKFDKTGLGSDGKAKEAANTAFNFLKDVYKRQSFRCPKHPSWAVGHALRAQPHLMPGSKIACRWFLHWIAAARRMQKPQ